MHELIVDIVKTKNGNFQKLTCTEGHYITSWKDTDDIKDFSASRIVCCPLTINVYETYRCITDAEWLELSSAQLKALEEFNEKTRQELDQYI